MKKKEKDFKQNTKYAGIHLIAEFWGGKIIENPQKIKNILIEAAKKSKNTALGVSIHKFIPKGVTGFILLAESHISIHTWPERNYVAVDIFSCGKNSQPYRGLEYLKKEFKPLKIKVREIKRGR